MTKGTLWLTLLICFFKIPGIAQTLSDKNNDSDKPNIIFILTDDQRWDAVGYAGNPLAYTPEMDKLAKSGAFFHNTIVTTPICAASRASILTGLYERTHAYNFQTGPIREEYMELAYPRLLKEAGYHVGFYGKLGVNYKDTDALFDDYEVYDRNSNFKDKRGYFYKKIGNDTVHLTRYTGQQALDFINKTDKNQPFSLSLSFSAPHAHDPAEEQYFWQQETDYLLQGIEVPKAAFSEDHYFDRLPEMVKSGFNRLRWTWRFDTPEKYQHSVKGYYRMIAGIDLEIAKIRKALQEKGLDKNTVIIVMGDNGYFLGERQLAGKWLLYEHSIKVPLIIYDPRVNKHLEIDEMALNIDIPSTILDLAKVNPPQSWQGVSLMPVVSGEKTTINRDTILIEHLWEFDNIPPSEGVRTQDWKYFRYVNDQSTEELYHLKNDPDEIHNLAENTEYFANLIQFRQKCDALTIEMSDASTASPGGLTIEFLREPAAVPLMDHTPEFGWMVPEKAGFQSAYQILVSDSEDKINQNQGNVWNSRRVKHSASSNISYQGPDLEHGVEYFWKVRIWDDDNRLSRYSRPQKFQLGNLSNQLTTPNIIQIESLKPKSFVEKDGRYFLDFGKAAFASMEFNYRAQEKDTVIIRIGEQLASEGEINRNPKGLIRYQKIKVAVNPEQARYQLNISPDVRNTGPTAVILPKSFPVLMPYRYAELENFKGKIEPADFTQLAYFGYFDDDASNFTSSDTILNQIWDLCKYSIKATSFAGLYIDGDRERIPYEADAYINQLSHYAVDREYPIARSTIEYFMENPTWPTEWQLHMALMFYEDYQYTGNSELIAKYYDKLKHKTLMELARSDGLISSESTTEDFMKKLGFKDPSIKLKDIVDWPPAQKDTDWELATEEGERDGFVFKPINTVINSLYFRNLQIMAEFAGQLGKPEEAEAYQLMALRVKSAVNTKLFDPEKGVYIDGEGTDHSSLHANMMPLAFNMVPERNIPRVVEFIKSRGMACSVYGAQYLLEGLYHAGETGYALELMTATHDRSWWNMIAIGSTITLEAWDMKYKPNADWNHAWGAVPGNIIARKMWGITPGSPGARMLNIRPQLSPLTDTEIEIPFLTGQVKATYKKINNRLQRYVFELPANVSAELFLKFGADEVITLNGAKVNTAFTSIRLNPGLNEIELQVNSF